jgi:2'-5' RNA ligase
MMPSPVRYNLAMRMFLAIELPSEVRNHLARMQSQLAKQIGKASFTRAENLHITLKFLGEVRDNEVEPLVESLRAIKASAPISLEVTKLECFPTRGPVRILAAIFAGDEKKLAGIHAAIEQRCQYLGFEREQRKYTPHATLARARPILPPATRELAQRAAEGLFPGPSFEMREFVLMQSRLKASGAEYIVAARFTP